MTALPVGRPRIDTPRQRSPRLSSVSVEPHVIAYIAARAEALGITQAEVHRSLLQEGIDAVDRDYPWTRTAQPEC